MRHLNGKNQEDFPFEKDDSKYVETSFKSRLESELRQSTHSALESFVNNLRKLSENTKSIEINKDILNPLFQRIRMGEVNSTESSKDEIQRVIALGYLREAFGKDFVKMAEFLGAKEGVGFGFYIPRKKADMVSEAEFGSKLSDIVEKSPAFMGDFKVIVENLIKDLLDADRKRKREVGGSENEGGGERGGGGSQEGEERLSPDMKKAKPKPKNEFIDAVSPTFKRKKGPNFGGM